MMIGLNTAATNRRAKKISVCTNKRKRANGVLTADVTSKEFLPQVFGSGVMARSPQVTVASPPLVEFLSPSRKLMEYKKPLFGHSGEGGDIKGRLCEGAAHPKDFPGINNVMSCVMSDV